MPDLLDHLAVAPLPVAVDGLGRMFDALGASPFDDPAERAAWGGLSADRLGYAFVAGYSCALARLAPGISSRSALCVTEAGGGHPRAMLTRLEVKEGRSVVSGTKTFVTLGSLAEELLVVASVGAVEGRNSLRVVVVRADAPGVALTPGPETPFAPEIPHARLVLMDAPCARVLDGDGYLRVVKPFRTIEDLHVLLSALGYLVRVGREASWPRTTLERLLSLVASGLALASRAPEGRGVHVALGGLFADVRALSTDDAACPWAVVEDGVRARFTRDLPLLWVAEAARRARLETAWRSP